MKIIILILLIAGSFVFTDVYACSCIVPIDHDAAIKDSEFSYIGTVTDVEIKDDWQTVTFAIGQNIKGNIDNPHILYEQSLGSASCGMKYEIGHTYIVHENNWSDEQQLFSEEPNPILPRTNICTTEDMINIGSFSINLEYGYLDSTTSTGSLNLILIFIIVAVVVAIPFLYWKKKK